MIAFDFAGLKGIMMFGIYFFTLAFLCIRNDNVYVNIFLEFKGFKIYVCDLESEKLGKAFIYENCLVISRNDLAVESGNLIECWDFDNYIYINI